ncbi:TerC family protein [Desulfosarcina sp. OttesenSCG-928-A07]|nr:TerC family protein [Desulfosarcina sp. OttesenSCG-928-A07]
MIGEYSVFELLLFAVLVIGALILDLHAHKSDRPISMRDAALWSVFWIALSLAFAVYVSIAHGRAQGMLFLTGYFLEKSLSVDNLFVFIAIFSSFSIRPEFQHRILYFGIIGAVVMRLIFVVLGSSFIALFGKWALTLFGVFVLWTAWKMWQSSRQEAPEIEDYSQHWAVRLTQRIFPVSPQLHGHNFFVRHEGRCAVTPLFLCLVVIEIADVMFAFDSVPAVFSLFAGLKEPLPLGTQTFLVYTSNIFAILGLRSLYFLLAAANRFLSRLEAAVIVILVFIGIKMLLGVVGTFHVPAEVSLAVVFGVLGAGVVASYFFPKKSPSDSEHPIQ